MESKELPADPDRLFETAEAAARVAAGRHAQIRTTEARLRAAIAWARFAHNGYLAVLESAETFPEARDFVEIARDHDARAEQHLRRRLVAFMNSNARPS